MSEREEKVAKRDRDRERIREKEEYPMSFPMVMAALYMSSFI
jgi:hypothetical protein